MLSLTVVGALNKNQCSTDNLTINQRGQRQRSHIMTITKTVFYKTHQISLVKSAMSINGGNSIV